jgi:hypothetical protein
MCWSKLARHGFFLLICTCVILRRLNDVDIMANVGPSGARLRRGSAAARLLVLRVRIPARAWISASCGCRVLSGRGLHHGAITRSEESYRVRCVWV